MIFRVFGYDKELIIKKGEVGLLNINNSKIYIQLQKFFNSKDLFNSSNDFVIEGDQRIKFDDFLYIDNLVLYNFDNKKIIAKIISNYVTYLNADEEENKDIADAVKIITKNFEKYVIQEEYDIDFEEDTISAILKACHIEMVEEGFSLLDKLNGIVNAYSKLFKTYIFVFNNLHQFMNREELAEVEKVAKKYDSIIIIMENRVLEEKLFANSLTILEDFGIF